MHSVNNIKIFRYSGQYVCVFVYSSGRRWAVAVEAWDEDVQYLIIIYLYL